MQTFLPETDFGQSAHVLDPKRLMKQRIENLQILKSLAGLYPTGAWRNHPAVKMWAGHEDWLMLYNEAILKEVFMRGYKDNTHEQFDNIYSDNFMGMESEKPWWLGDTNFHYTHKGRLFEKNPEHYYFYDQYSDYKEQGYTCCTECNYYWPVLGHALMRDGAL
jgi:hypothetical protein